MLRFTCFLVFAFNVQEDPKTNLLAILIVVGNLFLWLWISGGVYTNKYINILEGSFALNLIILTIVTYCVKLFRANQLIVEYTWITSVSVAFATFIVILVFQLTNVTGIIQCFKGRCATLKLAIRNQAEAEVEPSDIDFLPDRLILAIRNQAEAEVEPSDIDFLPDRLILAIRNQAEAEVEPSDIDFLPDQLINPGEYEPPFHTHATAGPTEEAHEARLITPVYTYGSID